MTDLTKKLDEARESNDPTKMRAALQDARKPMMDMKNHVDQWVHMMDMMQDMGGMMMKKKWTHDPHRLEPCRASGADSSCVATSVSWRSG